jgi:hypothetical protein
VAATLLFTASASAGTWVQASCRNADGSSAGSAGWSTFTQGSPGYGSSANAGCSSSGVMSAYLSTAAGAPVGTAEVLQYTPPAGSQLNGGSVSVALYADGFGYDAAGTAVVYSPSFTYDASDVQLQCAYGVSACGGAGHPYDFSGNVSVPGGRGGSFYVAAACGGVGGQICNQGGSQGYWSLVQVGSADMELTNAASPSGSSFTGTLLEPGATGTADVAFTATDAGGPGVYRVTATVDGTAVYSGTPDTNGGACVSTGTYASAYVFDAAQPCKTSESVDVPIDTTQLKDGTHVLKVSVEDAAQNTSTAYDGTITTANAPVAAGAPLIGGTPQVGEQLAGTDTTFAAPAGQTATVRREWEDCDGQGGGCQAISGASGTAYTLTSTDLGHTVRYADVASDASGSVTVQSAATAVVANPPADGTAQGSIGPPTTSVTNVTESNSVTNDALSVTRGAANGTPASDTATLDAGWTGVSHTQTITVRAARSRRVTKRVVTTTTAATGTHAIAEYGGTATAHGRLIATNGQPIAGATIEVFSTPAAAGATEFLEGTATTASDGTFEFVTHSREPSRTLAFEYRSHVNDVGVAGEAQLSVAVPVPVTVGVTPHSVHRGSTVTITGSIPGPIPNPGTLVTLQARASGGGAWTTFQVIRAGPAGTFRSSYRFRLAATVTYLMRALVNTQAGYPFAGAASASVAIHEH